MKAYVNPKVAFPFEEDFSIGTIHGANATKLPAVPPTETAAPDNTPTGETPSNQNTMIEILEDNAENDVSMLTTKTQDELVALLVKAGDKSMHPPEVELPLALVSPLEAA
jgi:hypothetical protein